MKMNHKKIEAFINKNDIEKYSITQLAEKIGVSHSAIIRYAKDNGFSGFKEFKFFETRRKNNSKNVNKNNYVYSLSRTLDIVDQDSIETIGKAILKYKKINIVAEDFAFNVAESLMRLLRKININASTINSSGDVHLVIPDESAVFIFISLSGRNVKFKRIIDKINSGNNKTLKIFSISGGDKSKISSKSNASINCFSYQEDFDLKEYPLVPMINVTAIINLIFEYVYKQDKPVNDNITIKFKERVV